MEKFAVAICTAGLLVYLLTGCGQGKSTSAPPVSQQEIQEIQSLDSVSSELDNSIEELKASEEDLLKALEELN